MEKDKSVPNREGPSMSGPGHMIRQVVGSHVRRNSFP
jgi:hypothetical protein